MGVSYKTIKNKKTKIEEVLCTKVLASKSESDKDYTFNGPFFICRHDLSIFDRMTIAFTTLIAQKYKIWALITELSIQYMVSRTFIYILAKTLQESAEIFFGDNQSEQTLKDRKLPLSYMLSLRMEGRCSIGASSIIMERFDIELASTGSISEYTKKPGLFLPNLDKPEPKRFSDSLAKITRKSEIRI